MKEIINQFFKANHKEISNLQEQKKIDTSSTRHARKSIARRIDSVFSNLYYYTNTSYRNENYHSIAGKVIRVAVLKVSWTDETLLLCSQHLKS